MMALLRSLRALVPLALAVEGSIIDFQTARRPPCRKSPEFHSLTWPDGSERVVLFGGKGFDYVPKGKKGKKIKKKVTMFGDTWAFDNEDGQWIQLGQPDGPSPVSRWKPSSCTIDGGRALVLFGGDHITDISGVMQDLWVFRTDNGPGLGYWTQVRTENVPKPRRGHILEAFSTHLLIMGGKTYVPGTKGVVLSDVWLLPLEALEPGTPPMSWVSGAKFPGDPRWGATGTLVRSPHGSEIMAVFGGRHLNTGAGFHSTASGAYTYYNEVWLYSLEDNSWSKPNIKGPSPSERDHHGVTALGGDLWIFGGRRSEERSSDAVLNDLWSFSLSTMSWTLHEPLGGVVPIARYMPGVAGTTLDGKPSIAVFGGETLPGSTKLSTMNDVWHYVPKDEDTGSWLLVMSSLCSIPAVAPQFLHLNQVAAGKPKAPWWFAIPAVVAGGVVLFIVARGRRAGSARGHDDLASEPPYVRVE